MARVRDTWDAMRRVGRSKVVRWLAGGAAAVVAGIGRWLWEWGETRIGDEDLDSAVDEAMRDSVELRELRARISEVERDLVDVGSQTDVALKERTHLYERLVSYQAAVLERRAKHRAETSRAAVAAYRAALANGSTPRDAYYHAIGR